MNNSLLQKKDSDKINVKNVRRIILKVLVVFGIIYFLFFIAIKITNKKLSELSGTVSVILEPDVNLVRLKEISASLYDAEANVKAFTVRQDSAYLLSYGTNISDLNSQLDTLLSMSSQNKIVDAETAKEKRIFLLRMDTLQELIVERIGLFSEYIELKAGKLSSDPLLHLLQRIKIKDPEPKKVQPLIAVPVEPKKSFFSRIFSSKKKKEEIPLPALPVVSLDSVHGSFQEIVKQALQTEKIKEGREMSDEISIAQKENAAMNRIFALLNGMEKREITEKIKRVGVATADTSNKINFISNMLTAFGIFLALMFSYFIYRDIRRANRFREQLLAVAEGAAQKAEEATRLKETFLANMSHEIRTPMNAIIGFSTLLSKKDLGEKEKEYARAIKSSGENLLAIINDILDISKIEAGMMTFEESPFSVKEIFKTLNLMMAEKATEKKIELFFDCDENVPDFLLGDPTRLSQIIINLTGNAIKFTSKGEVKVVAKIVGGNNEKNDEEKSFILEFSVSDTGIGIPEDKLADIFERFTQAETNTTRKYGGTGLGLSIARQLVELQKGTLSVKSVFDEGSVFTFCLSYKESAGAKKEKENEKQDCNMEELGKLKILLVEDNPLNIMLISSLFSERNLTIEVAKNGKLGVEKMKENKFDIILMDMEMPVMTGYEASGIIRDELKSNIPIIALTANAMAGEKEKCLGFGMNDYLSKPLDADLLFEKIYELTRDLK